MKRTAQLLAVAGLSCFSIAVADPKPENEVKVDLSGYQEVPAVSTGATSTFRATISDDESSIQWELSYADLEGAIQQVHIHVGNHGVNGGVSVFLCTNLGNGPAGMQPCPASPATISGTITAADVSPNIPATAAARTQGINTGELNELIAAMRAGVTYVNVHSTMWPGGEVRSQVVLSKKQKD